MNNSNLKGGFPPGTTSLKFVEFLSLNMWQMTMTILSCIHFIIQKVGVGLPN